MIQLAQFVKNRRKQLGMTQEEFAEKSGVALTNGSGKSTIINAVRDHKVSEIPVDFGIYISAEVIANGFLNGTVSFNKFKIKILTEEFDPLYFHQD